MTNAHIVFFIRGFEHHTIQPIGLLGSGDLTKAVEDAATRFCDEIGLVAIKVEHRQGATADGWHGFHLRLGTGRTIEISARETTAHAVKVEG